MSVPAPPSGSRKGEASKGIGCFARCRCTYQSYPTIPCTYIEAQVVRFLSRLFPPSSSAISTRCHLSLATPHSSPEASPLFFYPPPQAPPTSHPPPGARKLTAQELYHHHHPLLLYISKVTSFNDRRTSARFAATRCLNERFFDCWERNRGN